MSIHYRGGARVGWSRSTWPFATLTATRGQLTLSVFPWGTFHLAPSDVHAIERGMFSGVVIQHAHPDYPRHLEFYASNPAGVIEHLDAIGFHGTASADEVAAIPKKSTAWRPATLIAALVIWEVAAFLDIGSGPDAGKLDGAFIVALVLTFVVATLMHFSAGLQNLLLRPGRVPAEVRIHLVLAQLVAAALTLFLLLSP